MKTLIYPQKKPMDEIEKSIVVHRQKAIPNGTVCGRCRCPLFIGPHMGAAGIRIIADPAPKSGGWRFSSAVRAFPTAARGRAGRVKQSSPTFDTLLVLSLQGV